MRAGIPWLLGMSIWAVAGDSRACKPLWDHRFVTLPFVDAPGLELGEHSATLECSARRRVTTCRIRARYELVPRATEPWTGHVAVFWTAGASLGVTLDGQPGTTAIPAELRARAAAAMVVEDPLGAGAALQIDPGHRVVVEVEGPVEPGTIHPACQAATVRLRHVLVTRDSGSEHTLELVADPTLPSARTGEIRLRVPRWWGHSGRGDRRQPGWFTQSMQRGDRIGRVMFERRPPVWPGGPFVAVGVDVREQVQLKLRAGWEIAAPRLLFWSIAVESDAKRHVEVVPTVELTLPRSHTWFFGIPVPSIGLGAPVQVWPHARAGVRTHVGLHWLVAGLVGFFDAYPATRDRPRQLLGGVAVQLSI